MLQLTIRGKRPCDRFDLFIRIAVWSATRINALVDYAAKHDVTCQPVVVVVVVVVVVARQWQQ